LDLEEGVFFIGMGHGDLRDDGLKVLGRAAFLQLTMGSQEHVDACFAIACYQGNGVIKWSLPFVGDVR
jgi:hypothetical protein